MKNSVEENINLSERKRFKYFKDLILISKGGGLNGSKESKEKGSKEKKVIGLITNSHKFLFFY